MLCLGASHYPKRVCYWLYIEFGLRKSMNLLNVSLTGFLIVSCRLRINHFYLLFIFLLCCWCLWLVLWIDDYIINFIDWRQEAVSKAEILRLIYQGRFLHSNVTLGALGLPFGKTTVMHLVPRENLPEPNSQGTYSLYIRGGLS